MLFGSSPGSCVGSNLAPMSTDELGFARHNWGQGSSYVSSGPFYCPDLVDASDDDDEKYWERMSVEEKGEEFAAMFLALKDSNKLSAKDICLLAY